MITKQNAQSREVTRRGFLSGQVRLLAAATPNSYGIWSLAHNKEAAMGFLKYYADHWVDASKASTGYSPI
jgi:hypothetical protein